MNFIIIKMSELDNKTNFITTVAVIFGSLSLTDTITFFVGLVVLLLAGISNYYSIKKHKAELQNALEKRKKEDEE